VFVGSIPQDLRGLLAELAPAWRGRPIYVGCSGNFVVERVLASVGVLDLHSNDISLYSCVLGAHLAATPCPVGLLPDTPYQWMAPYVEPGGVSLIAHLLIAMEYAKFLDRVEPYHRRMAAAYVADWPRLHAKTVDRVKAAIDALRITSFFAGDVVDHIGHAPPDAVVISFPPTYSGGYERLYKKFKSIFAWTPPSYTEFTPERFAALTARMQEQPDWVTLRDEAVPELTPSCIGSFQPTPRSKTVFVYAGTGHARVSIPAQKTEPIPMARLEGVASGPLRIVRLSAGQMNLLRSEYLATGIAPAGAQVNLGIVVGDRLAGACGFSLPTLLGGWCDAYQMSDFSVRPTIYTRLSKLVLAAILTHDVKLVLEQAFSRRITTIGTTAFTQKAVSMKYRGLWTLYSRKEGGLNYIANAGRWSCAEALHWWSTQHGATR
jgi:hypothetical protein